MVITKVRSGLPWWESRDKLTERECVNEAKEDISSFFFFFYLLPL